jgi:predicted PurR-regulated permease PerM
MSSTNTKDTKDKKDPGLITTIQTDATTQNTAGLVLASIIIPFLFLAFAPATAIGVIFMGGAAIGLGSGAIRSATSSSQDIKNQIAKLNRTNKEMSEKLKNANKQIIDLTEDAKNEYINSISQYMNLKDTIKQNTLEFSKNLKKIEVNGIIIIVIVFFLLLLKQFDLLSPLYSIIFYPFIYIYNSIVNIFHKK